MINGTKKWAKEQNALGSKHTYSVLTLCACPLCLAAAVALTKGSQATYVQGGFKPIHLACISVINILQQQASVLCVCVF